MVQLDVVRACGEALVNKQSVTAVFVGGTSGVGEYSLRALAALHGLSGHGLRVYHIGRNLTAANKIIADCKRACPVGISISSVPMISRLFERSTSFAKRSYVQRKTVLTNELPLICLSCLRLISPLVASQNVKVEAIVQIILH